MAIRNSAYGRICSLLFAVVFLAAAEGQALGLRHCSLHDALPHSGAASNPVESSSRDHGASPDGITEEVPARGHHADRGAAAHEHDHAGGPGGCMDDCHIGSPSSADPGDGPVSPWSLRAFSGSVDGSASLEGHRHDSFELHLPNAPPSSV